MPTNVALALPVPVMFVSTCVGLPTKSAMLLVKHDVVQLSMAIWYESDLYLKFGAAGLAAVKQQSTSDRTW